MERATDGLLGHRSRTHYPAQAQTPCTSRLAKILMRLTTAGSSAARKLRIGTSVPSMRNSTSNSCLPGRIWTSDACCTPFSNESTRLPAGARLATCSASRQIRGLVLLGVLFLPSASSVRCAVPRLLCRAAHAVDCFIDPHRRCAHKQKVSPQRSATRRKLRRPAILQTASTAASPQHERYHLAARMDRTDSSAIALSVRDWKCGRSTECRARRAGFAGQRRAPPIGRAMVVATGSRARSTSAVRAAQLDRVTAHRRNLTRNALTATPACQDSGRFVLWFFQKYDLVVSGQSRHEFLTEVVDGPDTGPHLCR